MPSENRNDSTELRAILFDTLRGLKNNTTKIEDAQAIREMAQVIINGAKVEVDYAKVVGGAVASGFLPGPDNGKSKKTDELPQHPGGLNVLGSTIHKLRG